MDDIHLLRGIAVGAVGLRVKRVVAGGGRIRSVLRSRLSGGKVVVSLVAKIKAKLAAGPLRRLLERLGCIRDRRCPLALVGCDPVRGTALGLDVCVGAARGPLALILVTGRGHEEEEPNQRRDPEHYRGE